MREHAIFVPHEGEYLAAVLTLPDTQPVGLALLLCGFGAPRSHRYQMWTRTARRIAAGGMATLRMDYVGIGDSTGTVREFRAEHEALCLAQARAVLDAGLRLTGVDRVAIAGNCLGARVAMAIAAERDDVAGVVGILPPLVKARPTKARLAKAKRSSIARVVRSNRVLRSVVLSRLRAMEGSTGSAVRGWFTGTLEHGRLLFLFGQDDHRLTPRMEAEIEVMLASLPESQRARYELRVLPQGPVAGFESVEIQEATIEAVSGFAVRCLRDPTVSE